MFSLVTVFFSSVSRSRFGPTEKVEVAAECTDPRTLRWLPNPPVLALPLPHSHPLLPVLLLQVMLLLQVLVLVLALARPVPTLRSPSPVAVACAGVDVHGAVAASPSYLLLWCAT